MRSDAATTLDGGRAVDASNARSNWMSRRRALALALTFLASAAIDGARAVPLTGSSFSDFTQCTLSASCCVCTIAACTLSTLSTSCNIVSGDTINGHIELTSSVTSFTLTGTGPQITKWNGNLFGRASAFTSAVTIDLSTLVHMNGTFGFTAPDTGPVPDITWTFTNLKYATRIDIGTTQALSFPELISTGISTTHTDATEVDYTASPGNAEWSLQVKASNYNFPKLTTTRGSPGVSGWYSKGLGLGAAGATAFPVLATIIGDFRDDFGDASKYPALANVTGSFSLADSSDNWYPVLQHVGGTVYVGESGVGFGINSNFVPGNWPPLLTHMNDIQIVSYSWDGSPTTLTTISLPIVKCRRLEVDVNASSSVRTLEFPALTEITSYVLFAGTLALDDIKMPVLASLGQNVIFRVTSFASSGMRPMNPTPDSTPVTVHVPCTNAMLPILTGYGGSDYVPYCTGCSLCNAAGQGGGSGGGGGGPSIPSAVTVTTASLSAAVSACFAENAAGNCQCSGASCGDLSGPISQWSFTGTNLDMGSLFEGRTTFNQPVGSWDVSGATSMKKMFKNASSFNQPIGGWDTSSVIDMTEMFAGATAFARDISGWDVDQVTTYTDMFDGADAFNAKYSCTGPKCSGDPKLGLTDAQTAGVAVGCIAFVVVLIIIVCIRQRRRNREKLRERLGLSPASASPQQPQIIVIQQQP